MGQWKFTAPDGHEYVVTGDNEDGAFANLREQIQQETKDEYSRMPWYQQAGTAANDVMRIGGDALSFGGADWLESKMPWSEGIDSERFKTAQARTRAGSAAIPIDALSYMGIGKFLPGGGPAAAEAIGGPGAIRAITSGGTSAIETAAIGGTEATARGNDVQQGMLGGALAGLGGSVAGGLVKGGINGFQAGKEFLSRHGLLPDTGTIGKVLRNTSVGKMVSQGSNFVAENAPSMPSLPSPEVMGMMAKNVVPKGLRPKAVPEPVYDAPDAPAPIEAPAPVAAPVAAPAPEVPKLVIPTSKPVAVAPKPVAVAPKPVAVAPKPVAVAPKPPSGVLTVDPQAAAKAAADARKIADDLELQLEELDTSLNAGPAQELGPRRIKADIMAADLKRAKLKATRLERDAANAQNTAPEITATAPEPTAPVSVIATPDVVMSKAAQSAMDARKAADALKVQADAARAKITTGSSAGIAGRTVKADQLASEAKTAERKAVALEKKAQKAVDVVNDAATPLARVKAKAEAMALPPIPEVPQVPQGVLGEAGRATEKRSNIATGPRRVSSKPVKTPVDERKDAIFQLKEVFDRAKRQSGSATSSGYDRAVSAELGGFLGNPKYRAQLTTQELSDLEAIVHGDRSTRIFRQVGKIINPMTAASGVGGTVGGIADIFDPAIAAALIGIPVAGVAGRKAADAGTKRVVNEFVDQLAGRGKKSPPISANSQEQLYQLMRSLGLHQQQKD